MALKTMKIPNEQSILKWIEKGFVPSYMIPKSYFWYDVGGIDSETGIEYTKVGDREDAKGYFDRYVENGGKVDDESEPQSEYSGTGSMLRID